MREVPSDAPERKLMVMISADVVGFSYLTGEDDEGTYLVLCECFTQISGLVSAWGGGAVKFIGDAVFVGFTRVVALATGQMDEARAVTARVLEINSRFSR